MTDAQTLLSQAKCYLCLPVSLAEALELALLAQIVSGSGSGIVLGPWVEPQLPGWPARGTPGQEVLLNWTNTTGKIQWFQCSVALSMQGAQVSICDFYINGTMFPHYSPQTASGDEEDFFFSAILAPNDVVTTVYDLDVANTHRVQTLWYRTMN